MPTFPLTHPSETLVYIKSNLMSSNLFTIVQQTRTTSVQEAITFLITASLPSHHPGSEMPLSNLLNYGVGVADKGIPALGA